MDGLLWSTFLTVQILMYGAFPVFINLSKEDGVIKYSTTAMNFLVELLKLAFSISCYMVLKVQHNIKKKQISDGNESLGAGEGGDIMQREDESLKFSFKTSIFYLLPAFLYFINNNLTIYMLHEMDSATFQVLGNLKILTTAVLFYIILRKSLSRLKWFSLFLLFIAGIFYVFGNIHSADDSSTSSSHRSVLNEMFITHVGIIMILVYSFISGFSGVYSEYLLKKNFRSTIHTQNIYLYAYGTIFNFITASVSNESSEQVGIFSSTIFHSFNRFTWIYIFSQVFTGFGMSVIMKHASNITRLFVISSSLIVTTVLSVVLFSLKLNFYFYASFIVIIIAIYFYTKK